jgi:hypothetical protein
VLVECLTGRYPFDATGGPMELIIHVGFCPATAVTHSLQHGSRLAACSGLSAAYCV